jgi:hypothetical protein
MTMGRATTIFISIMCAAQWLGCNDNDLYVPDDVNGGTGGSAGKTVTGTGGKATGGKSGADAGAAGVSGQDAGWVEAKWVDRSGLTDVGTAGSLDYSRPGMWACRPDMEPNVCNSNLDATLIKSSGERETVIHDRTENPEFDCFYVYPTVLLSGAAQMVDFSEAGVKMVADALLPQAARFSRICQIYAPLYRQVGLGTTTDGGVTMTEGADRVLALKDVRDAFAFYLKNFNHGRKFVLMGHSQGTGMLVEMMKQDIDPENKSDVRARMISALLIGGSVLVPKGEQVGGSYKNIPLCSKPGETGCVITYASFASDKPRAATSMFGATTEEGMEVGCTNPATLSGNTGRYLGSYFAKRISNASFKPDTALPADLDTPFALYRDLFKGACVSKDGANYLEITIEPVTKEDKRTPPWRNAAVEGPAGMGLHLVDYQIPLEDLIQAVQKQAANSTQP